MFPNCGIYIDQESAEASLIAWMEKNMPAMEEMGSISESGR